MPFGPFLLQWRAPSPNPPPPSPLPQGISRSYIPTQSGPLELLRALPTTKTPHEPHLPPLFFAHGGFGCAEVWIPYMQFFAARGYPCYAVSYRGHGKSWYPGYWRMLVTSRGEMGADLVAGIEEVGRLEAERRRMGDGFVEVVLLAHSAGGALSQYVLSRGLVRVRALALCASVPGFGSASVYRYFLRYIPLHAPFRLWHPRYPLATTSQVKACFFSQRMSMAAVGVFERLLAPYESLLWPIQFMPRISNGVDVLRRISGFWSEGREVAERRTSGMSCMLVVAAEYDVLCRPPLMLDMCDRYRKALAEMKQGKSEEQINAHGDQGVSFVLVKGIAHHLQNDVGWENGAEEILGWLRGS